MVSKPIEKILITVAVLSTLGGMNFSHPKASTALLLLGDISGSIYLFLAPKPWDVASKRREQLRRIIRNRCELLKQLRQHSNSLQSTRTLTELTELITQRQQELNQAIQEKVKAEVEVEELLKFAEDIALSAETEAQAYAEKIKQQALHEADQIKQDAQLISSSSFNEQQNLVDELSRQREQLTLENKQLKKLADEMLAECDRTSRIEAQRIKQQATVEAQRIIEATKQSLNNTVFEPEKISHLQILAQIQSEKDVALSELERVQSLQEKTRVAIEKMKQSAQSEHLQIKKKLQEQAKAQFLREMERMQEILGEMENQIKLLTTENQMLRSEIDSLDEPQYPDGWKDHEVYARGIIDFYKGQGVKLDYKLSFKEGDRIAVRVVPREDKVGEQQLRKFHDRIQRLFDLSQLPNISTTAGTIQFDLRLCELQSPVIDLIPVSSTPYSLPPTPQLHPELVDVQEMLEHLERAQQREFIPPNNRFSPFTQLSTTEKEWVLWLYNHCRISDQNTIIYTVWQNTRGRGISQGAGGVYIAARDKLHRIFDEAGIPRRKANNAKDSE